MKINECNLICSGQILFPCLPWAKVRREGKNFKRPRIGFERKDAEVKEWKWMMLPYKSLVHAVNVQLHTEYDERRSKERLRSLKASLNVLSNFGLALCLCSITHLSFSSILELSCPSLRHPRSFIWCMPCLPVVCCLFSFLLRLE